MGDNSTTSEKIEFFKNTGPGQNHSGDIIRGVLLTLGPGKINERLLKQNTFIVMLEWCFHLKV